MEEIRYFIAILIFLILVPPAFTEFVFRLLVSGIIRLFTGNKYIGLITDKICVDNFILSLSSKIFKKIIRY